MEIFYNVAVTPWFRVARNVQFIRPAAGNLPREYFRRVGHLGEVLIPGSEETANKSITNTRQSLKEFRDPVVKQPMIV